MVQLITQLSKYIVIVLITIYTYLGFSYFRFSEKRKKRSIMNQMYGLMILIHLIQYMVLFVNTENIKVVTLYACELVIIIFITALYHWIYPNINELVMQHMMMLLTIGFVFMTRLSYHTAVRQVAFAGVALLFCIIVPIVIEKFSALIKFSWILGLIGIGLLVIVLLFGVENYGATNWISVAGVQIQPSEFVKIIFIIAFAGLLSQSKDFKQIFIVSAFAAAYVLVLVFEKDLGGALLFFVTYVAMLVVATENVCYLFVGLGAGCVAAVVAYKFFYHVQVRVMAWSDPWTLIDNQGYQVTQSLFAIGTGSWLGLGLNHGLPTSIPVVTSDFIFSAMVEEMGAVFAICVILIFMSCFIMFINIAMKLKNPYYKLMALGFSIMYAFQIFLNIGGVTKLIPSTGVTLPLISSGGSSIFATIIIFSIIQGLYVRNTSKVTNESNNKKRKQKAIQE